MACSISPSEQGWVWQCGGVSEARCTPRIRSLTGPETQIQSTGVRFRPAYPRDYYVLYRRVMSSGCAEVEFCSSTTRFGDFCRQVCQTCQTSPAQSVQSIHAVYILDWTGFPFRIELCFRAVAVAGVAKSSSKIYVQPRGSVKLRAPDASTIHHSQENYCSMLISTRQRPTKAWSLDT